MNRFTVWMGGVLIALVAMSARESVAAAPALPANDYPTNYSTPAEFAAGMGALSGSSQGPMMSGRIDADGLSAPLATSTSTAVVPLPPGVVFGLVGLASAAIARRRFLKRH